MQNRLDFYQTLSLRVTFMKNEKMESFVVLLPVHDFATERINEGQNAEVLSKRALNLGYNNGRSS